MQHISQDPGLTPIETTLVHLCTQFTPRSESDEDLDILATVLKTTPRQVHEALTHLQDVGLLQPTADPGCPVIVTARSS